MWLLCGCNNEHAIVAVCAVCMLCCVTLLQYEALERAPSGVPYQRKDRVALLLAYEFLKAHEQSVDRRDPVFWPISRYHAKKYDFLKFDNTPALNTNAVSPLDLATQQPCNPTSHACSQSNQPTLSACLRLL